jgi:hypothetical protein
MKMSYIYILVEDLNMEGKAAAQTKVDGLIQAGSQWEQELHDEVLVFIMVSGRRTRSCGRISKRSGRTSSWRRQRIRLFWRMWLDSSMERNGTRNSAFRGRYLTPLLTEVSNATAIIREVSSSMAQQV